MKRIRTINLALLIALGLGTSAVKFLAMPEEMNLFAKLGFSNSMTIAFGALQFIGTLLLLAPRTRQIGAGILLGSFVIGTIALFNANQMPFAPLSILFIAMAGLAMRNQTGKESAQA